MIMLGTAITLQQYREQLKLQGVGDREHVAFRCPACRTVQSFASLQKRGGMSKDIAMRALGHACEGNAKSAPPAKDGKPARNDVVGCSYTLGGIVFGHRLVVVMPDGKRNECFPVATKAEAMALQTEMSR